MSSRRTPPGSAFSVRPASATDVGSLERMLGDFQAGSGWPRGPIHEGVRATIGTDAAAIRVVLAEDATGAAVGFVSTCALSDLGEGPGAWLSDLYVCREWRRRGVGRALVCAAAARALEDGAVWMMWHAARGDRGSRKFYASLGADGRPEQMVTSIGGAAFEALARPASD